MYAGNLDLTQPFLWTLDDILTSDECRELIARIEAAGPTAATINDGASGGELRPEIRNNGRVIFDDAALAALLFERVRARIPVTLKGMQVTGANERLRCYRYEPGQFFAPHYDGSFIRNERERSLLTFMIYLNGDFEGGETAFPDLQVTIRPRPGLALLFQHMVLHESVPVTRGRKYAIRSDIMYSSAQRPWPLLPR